MYCSFKPHRVVDSVHLPDILKVSKSTITKSGKIKSVVVSEENSTDTVKASLEPYSVDDFSLSIAVETGNISSLKPNAVLPVSDFESADVMNEYVQSIQND